MEQNAQLAFSSYKNFRNAQRQNVHGFHFVELEPITKTDSLYEFEIGGNHPLMFGPGTGFRVEGHFEYKTDAADAAWAVAPVTEAKKFTLIQNWMDSYVKQVDVWYANQQVACDDMPPFVESYVNTYIYAHMHRKTKRMLCMEKVHPGNGVTVDYGNWKARGTADTTTKDDWHKYAANILGVDNFSFVYNPMHKFPFYQDANYVHTVQPNIVPIQAMGKMQIRMFLREDTSCLFNIMAANKNTYRFVLTKLTLLLKEMRLSPSMARTMMAFKGSHYYRGVTKVGICENVRLADFSHRATFPTIDLPEGLLIFCVDKKVLSGTVNFQDMSLDSCFYPHNIKSCDIHFHNQHFFIKEPNFGTFDNYQIKRDQYVRMLNRGPFGLLVDPDKVTFERQGEAKDWAFPCRWIDLTESSPHTRLQTVHLESQNVTNKMGDLTIVMNFDAPDGAKDYMYVLVAYYTDTNLQLDMRTKKFYPIYNKNKTIN